MKILGIIPARYGSTRFEGKPLVDICGKSMIQRVYEQAKKGLEVVYVATDDDRIANEVKRFGGKVVMTSADHTTGSNRCLEASEKIQAEYPHDVVINVQGDEPLLNPINLSTLAQLFEEDGVEFATLIKEVPRGTKMGDMTGVHVLKSISNYAIYFSRAVIPTLRGERPADWTNIHQYYHHIGVYGYTTDALKKFSLLPQSTLEQSEMLEQNRWIENGGKIKVAIVEDNGLAIDTPKDLEAVIKHLQNDS